MQVAYMQWFRLQYPRVICYATPNAGKRSPQLGAWLKEEGMLSGVADLTILHPSSKKHLLFIELKIPPNKPSQAQLDFIAYANSLDYLAVVCFSLEEAMNATKEHLKDYTC